MWNFQQEIKWFNRMYPEYKVKETLKAQGIEKKYTAPYRGLGSNGTENRVKQKISAFLL